MIRLTQLSYAGMRLGTKARGDGADNLLPPHHQYL